MGSVYPKTFTAIKEANGLDHNSFIVLSYDPSPWKGEHYFAVTKEVPGYEMERITGDFLTKVFEGPYKNAPKWIKEMEEFVKGEGRQVKKTYFFYTTCPKCIKVYGKNYVVAVSELLPMES